MGRTRGHAQGWYFDPYRRHGARWFSDGDPTELVRDDGVESRDPPPEAWFAADLEPVPDAEGGLLHAHADHGRPRRVSAVDAAWEVFVSTGGD